MGHSQIPSAIKNFVKNENITINIDKKIATDSNQVANKLNCWILQKLSNKLIKNNKMAVSYNFYFDQASVDRRRSLRVWIPTIIIKKFANLVLIDSH